jgi:hypothetical protein
MRTVLTLACALVLGGSAMARLGDTREDAEARYGLPKVEGTPRGATPFMEGARELTFEHQGWKLRCALLQATDGKNYIVREEYRKIWNAEVMKKGGTISIRDFERDAVLEAEGGRQAWSRGAVSPNQKTNDAVQRIAGAVLMAVNTWSRTDGAVAWEQLGGAIVLDLPQARRYEAELREIKERKSREDASKLYKPSSDTDDATTAGSPPTVVGITAQDPPIASTESVTTPRGAASERGEPISSSGTRSEVTATGSPRISYLFPFAILVGVIAAVNRALKGQCKSRSRKQRGTPDSSRASQHSAPTPSPVGDRFDSESRSIQTFKDLTWDEFEMFVGEMYRRKGYSVEISGGDGSDGGIDLVLRKDEARVLVQCKNWNSSKVGAREIREFFGVVIAEYATRGIFVTAGDYTRDALEFAEGKPIEMIDGPRLNALLAESLLQPGDDLLNVPFWAPFFAIEKSVRVVKPCCPFCKSSMALRRSPHGEFWGCRAFPKCKGKREARQYLAAAARG